MSKLDEVDVVHLEWWARAWKAKAKEQRGKAIKADADDMRVLCLHKADAKVANEQLAEVRARHDALRQLAATTLQHLECKDTYASARDCGKCGPCIAGLSLADALAAEGEG